MENALNLKNFIIEGKCLLNQTQEEGKKKIIERAIPHIEILLENDSDFILKRTTSKTNLLLVCILSQGMIYIKNEKTGEVEKATIKNVTNFLNATDYNHVNNVIFKELKWAPWERGFSTPHLTSFFTFAIHFPESAKSFVNHKLFLSDSCFADENFVNGLISANNKENSERIVRELIFAQDFLLKGNSLVKDINQVLNFFSVLNKQGVNFDKIKYNAEKIRKITEESDNYWWRSSRWTCGDENERMGFISEFNIDFNCFIDYLLYLLEVESLRCNFSDYYSSNEFMLKDYIDYLRMQKEMYGRVREKYPENWLSEHHKMASTYAAWKKLHENEIMLARSALMEKYLYKNSKYEVIIPKSSSDIVDEGYQLGHCVGSYVNRILDGETNIVFVRYKGRTDESLLTIEIKDGTICQCRGRGNRFADDEERKFLEQWAKKVNLILGC